MTHATPLPVIHSLGKTGATIICKCLGAMGNVALFSEIHPWGPAAIRMLPGQNGVLMHPAAQAFFWHKLIEGKERPENLFKQDQDAFLETMAFLIERARERGRQPLFRLWNHLDLVGQPYRPALGDNVFGRAVAARFPVREVAILRHPLRSWNSMAARGGVYRTITFSAHITAHHQLLDSLGPEARVFLHEDFVPDPASFLQELSTALALDYNPDWRERWRDNLFVTGDRNARKAGVRDIAFTPPRPVSEEMQELARSEAGYLPLLDRLGYEDSLI